MTSCIISVLKYISYMLHITFSKYDCIIVHKQGRPQDLGGGGQDFFFQIWEFACREAPCCAWRSHAHC